jgi:hypothetical protein
MSSDAKECHGTSGQRDVIRKNGSKLAHNLPVEV